MSLNNDPTRYYQASYTQREFLVDVNGICTLQFSNLDRHSTAEHALISPKGTAGFSSKSENVNSIYDRLINLKKMK